MKGAIVLVFTSCIEVGHGWSNVFILLLTITLKTEQNKKRTAGRLPSHYFISWDFLLLKPIRVIYFKAYCVHLNIFMTRSIF